MWETGGEAAHHFLRAGRKATRERPSGTKTEDTTENGQRSFSRSQDMFDFVFDRLAGDGDGAGHSFLSAVVCLIKNENRKDLRRKI
jgi:hypothetical protein